VRLVGMLLVVFIKIELHNYVQDVETREVGTGIMGMMVRGERHVTGRCGQFVGKTLLCPSSVTN
jgi:hypothetical protein